MPSSQYISVGFSDRVIHIDDLALYAVFMTLRARFAK